MDDLRDSRADRLKEFLADGDRVLHVRAANSLGAVLSTVTDEPEVTGNVCIDWHALERALGKKFGK